MFIIGDQSIAAGADGDVRAVERVPVVEGYHPIRPFGTNRFEQMGDPRQAAHFGETPFAMLVPHHLRVRRHVSVKVVDLEEGQFSHAVRSS